MKKNVKYLLFILVIALLFCTINQSYARFKTSESSTPTDIPFAYFIVNNQITDTLNFNISDFNPGDSKTIKFSVYNKDSSNRQSDVTTKYVIYIESYALPLQYSLVKDGTNNNLLTCSGVFGVSCNTRNENLILGFNASSRVNYSLTVTFPSVDSVGSPFSVNCSNSYDNIKIKIESTQLIN